MVLINEMKDLDKMLSTSATLFNQILLDLRTKPILQNVVDSFKKDETKITIYEAPVSETSLLNQKVSLMMSRLLNDPITLTAGLIPELYKKLCENVSFLIDYNTRNSYYRNSCFHVSRALYYIYQNNKLKLKDLESSRIGKLHRKKIRVTRDKILENAVVNMETYGCKKSILEFEFENEEGTGLGPTLEYYAIVSQEMKNPVHNLWRKTDNNMMFPSPIDSYDLKYPDPNKPKRRQSPPELRRDFEKFQLIFRCTGTFLARSILDDRIVDFPLHPVFWDLVLERPVHLEDICRIDKSLGDTLVGLQAIVNKKQEIEKDAKLSSTEKNNRIRNLTFKGTTIENLALNFTFPGYDEIDLIENGEDMPVTLSNLDQYVQLLSRYYLYESTKSQINAFRDGFNKVIPLKHLSTFKSEEIEFIICGGRRNEAWDMKTLEDNIVPAHGYSQISASYQNLIRIMSEFNEEHRKQFLKFVTGAERLPYGGFKSLNPKLTAVKKDPTLKTKLPDEYLPSVMTCQNYLKIPDYSSLEIMKMRLLYAMKEGQNSFNLS
jgi:E3 ubiquitin-protein ligase TRIP12